MPKYGEVREDGYIYRGLNQGRESWLSPEAWKRKVKRQNAFSRKYYHHNLEKSRERCREHQKMLRRRDPVKYRLGTVKTRAKAKGILFNLTPEDIHVPKRCPILGLKLNFPVGGEGNSDHNWEIDRIKPDQGYVPGNVVVICRRANRIKNDATLDELKKMVAFLENIQKE